jgi:hypothetical protein
MRAGGDATESSGGETPSPAKRHGPHHRRGYSVAHLGRTVIAIPMRLTMIGSVARSGPIDMRAQTDLLSALRPDTPRSMCPEQVGGIAISAEVRWTEARKSEFRTDRPVACRGVGRTTPWPSSIWWIKTAHIEDNEVEATIAGS